VSDARSRAASKLRTLGHEFVARDVDDAVLDEVAQRVEGILELLHSAPARLRTRSVDSYENFVAAIPQFGAGEPRHLFADSIVSGGANPMGIGAYLWRDGDQAVMEVVLGKAFEGAPERAHGGIVAALVDETMGLLLTINQTMAFTARLSIDYKAPTPILRTITARSWLKRRDGRKMTMRCDVFDGEVVVASADALFIAVDPTKFLPPGEGGRPS
jgi:acyl-coenzyme A thioesterase PaaI-like protein